MVTGSNSVEAYKASKGGDGLRIREDLPRFAREGWKSLTIAEKDLLKWVGVFFRKPTPGEFMMRIRMPNGFASSEQLRTIAELSRRLGNNVLDITTRQQVELRGFTIEKVEEIWEKLRAVDLRSLQTGMDNVRNINGCALAGLNPRELLDASPVVFELDRVIVGRDGNPEFTNLPRKFNVTVTGCRENCTHNESQDIALTPAASRGRPGFNVLVGGKMGSGGFTIASPLGVFVEPDQAAALVIALIRIYRDYGPRGARAKCRLAFLIEQWGVPRLRAELEYRMKRSLEPAGEDARLPGQADHLGITGQKQQGVAAVGLCVPTGRIDPDGMTELAHLADAYGNGQVRFTVGQNAILPNVPVERLARLLQEPLLRRFSPRPSPLLRGLVACVGTDFCNLAQIETKKYALAMCKALEQTVGNNLEPLTIHWSGCPAGCGNHQAADIGLRGMKVNIAGEPVEAVAVYVGGRSGPDAVAGEQILDAVPCDDALPGVLAGIVRQLQASKRANRGTATEEEPRPAVTRAAGPLSGVWEKRNGDAAAVAESVKVKLCRAEDLRRHEALVFHVEGRELAVFASEDKIFALDARCPHAGAPLHDGVLLGGRVICPGHGYGFELATGLCDASRKLRARTYPVSVEDGMVCVEIGE
jgi:ferredoxin-nitrite reductase